MIHLKIHKESKNSPTKIHETNKQTNIKSTRKKAHCNLLCDLYETGQMNYVNDRELGRVNLRSIDHRSNTSV